MHCSRSRALLAALTVAAALPAAASTIVPSTPVAQQAVELRLTVDSCTFDPSSVQVSASGATLRVTQRLNNCLVAGTPKPFDVRLGSFPAGDYRVEVYGTPTPTGTPAESLSFAVKNRDESTITPPLVHPLTDYSGFWWDPGQPGWGISLTQTPGTDYLFGAWYLYVSDGTPEWCTIEGGHWASPTAWAGSSPCMHGPLGRVTVLTNFALSLDFSRVAEGGPLVATLVSPGAAFLTYRLVRFIP